MRRAALPALFLALTACPGPGGTDGNETAQAAAPVVTVAGQGPDECRFQWNGSQVSAEALEDRAFAVVRQIVEEVGGIENLTIQAPPVFEVEAAPDTPFACISLALGELSTAAITRVAFRPVGGLPGPDAHLFLPNDVEPYVPAAVVEIGTGDRLYLNRDPIDLDRVRAQMEALSGTVGAPGDVVISPSGDASFGAIDRLVRAVRESGVELTIGACARRIAPPEPGEELIGELVPPCRGVTS